MSGEYLATCRSEITACTQTDLTPCRDDDVVMQGKTQRFAARLDLLRHLQVGIRRFGITTGVIVDHANEISNLLILQYYSGSLEMMVPRIGIGCSCPTVIITPDHPCVRQVVWMHGTALYSFRPTHQARQLDRAPPCQL